MIFSRKDKDFESTNPGAGRRVVVQPSQVARVVPAVPHVPPQPVAPARIVRQGEVPTSVNVKNPPAAAASKPGGGVAAPVTNRAVLDSENSRLFGGVLFRTAQLHTQQDLAQVLFHEIINEGVKLGAHLYSRIAIAKLKAGTKECALFVDKTKATQDDIEAVASLIKGHGHSLPATGIQGYFANSSLVIALSQGHLTPKVLEVDRAIANDQQKNALFNSFSDIIAWAYIKKADDIDFVVDVTSQKSQIAFKIAGRYIRPEQYNLPTDTVIQMLGIAWQKSAGGASSQFEIKTEQQAQLKIDIQKQQLIPEGAQVRLRWSGLANDKGTVVTMRIQRLGEYAKIRSLEQAGYLPSHIEIFKRVIHSEGGLVTLSGVVGSGKSTSLVQLLNMLPRDIKIQSIEDPVELDLPFGYQKTVTRDVASTGKDPAFHSAVRGLYRSALDVLYLGEVRDTETGMVARSVAESGHSVYTTTHARSALGIIDRFVSPMIGIPRDVLATPDILKLLVYQALLRVTCPHCGLSCDDYVHEFSIKGNELKAFDAYFERIHRIYNIERSMFKLRNSRGCQHCVQKDIPELNGFAGRTVVCEIVEPDEQMLEYILAGDNIKLNRYWRGLATPNFTDPDMAGKTTMECAVYKAALGIIDPREIEPRFMSYETVEAKRNLATRRSVEASINRRFP